MFQIRPDASITILAELCCPVLWRQENQILKNRGPARGPYRREGSPRAGLVDENLLLLSKSASVTSYQRRELHFLPNARTWATSAVICSSESFPLKDGMYLPLPSCITSEIC